MFKSPTGWSYSIWFKLTVYLRGAINPARDFGPRIFLSMALGSEAFSLYESFWWIPVVGPLVGGAISSIVYFLFISIHWPENCQTEVQSLGLNSKEENNNKNIADFWNLRIHIPEKTFLKNLNMFPVNSIWKIVIKWTILSIVGFLIRHYFK